MYKEKYRRYEEDLKLNELKTWENFDNYVQTHKNDLTKLINKENKYGKEFALKQLSLEKMPIYIKENQDKYKEYLDLD